MSGMQTAPYQDFAQEKLGFEFKNLDYLITALTHRSYVNEHKKSVTEHNERLEFLGDAVLELVVTDYLYRNYSEPEGIGDAGAKLGYEPLLRMSRGEKNGSDRARQQILANAFEAVIGAVYLERGYEEAEKFITAHILNKLEDILATGSWRDPKSHLQEVSQRIDGHTPVYKVLTEEGPDHDKIFTLGVYVGDKLMGKGSGSSKQNAQQEAAKAALVTYEKRKAA
jgi:ribonuclease-3